MAKKNTKKEQKPVRINGNISVDNNQTMYLVSYADLYKFINSETGEIKLQREIPADEIDKYEYDEDLSQMNYNQFKDNLAEKLIQKFPSLTTDTTFDAKNTRTLVQNKLFAVLLRDNEWSLAVQISSIPDGNKGLQTQMLPSFTNGLREILLNQFDEIYVRTGSFTTQPINKNTTFEENKVLTLNEDNDFPVEESLEDDDFGAR